MKFIELNRRFRDVTEEELEHPELLAAFGEQLYDSKTDDWAKLLESRRVVLLAEAGRSMSFFLGNYVIIIIGFNRL